MDLLQCGLLACSQTFCRPAQVQPHVRGEMLTNRGQQTPQYSAFPCRCPKGDECVHEQSQYSCRTTNEQPLRKGRSGQNHSARPAQKMILVPQTSIPARRLSGINNWVQEDAH